MIRRYRETDLKDLLAIWAFAHPFAGAGLLLAQGESFVAAYLDGADTWVWGDRGRADAAVSVRGSELLGLLLHPRRRISYAASLLLDHVLALRGELEVEVLADDDKSRRFYETHGFEVVGARLHPPTGLPLLRLALRRPVHAVVEDAAEEIEWW